VIKSGQVVNLDALPTAPIVTADWVDEASNPD